MLPSIGQDINDHLHERGGPLNSETWGDRRECVLCGYEPDEGETLHAVTRRGCREELCDDCALEHILEVQERFPVRDRDEQDARDALRIIARRRSPR
jgi:hypothetical protein